MTTLVLLLKRLSQYLNYYGAVGVWHMLMHIIKNKFLGKGVRFKVKVVGYGKILLRAKTADYSVFREIFLDEEYNAFERTALGLKLSAIFEGELKKILFLDLGANIGMASIYFYLRYPYLYFYMVEADSSNMDLLSYNTRLISKASVENIAAAETDKKIYFQKGENTVTGRVDTKKKSDSSNLVEVAAKAIPSIVESERIAMIKCDIEGYERYIFSGNNSKIIEENKIPIVIEPHDGIFNNQGSLSGILDSESHRNGCIIPNRSIVYILPFSCEV